MSNRYRILVVDDSAVDRRMVGSLLDRDDSLELEFVEDGAVALEAVDRRPPDLVLTDLIMPEVDGLELVSQLRKKHPLVPVVLMTSQGNEELAGKALRAGAASYVPKRLLAFALATTVHNLLEVAGRQKDTSRLLCCLVANELTFELNNDCSLIPPLVRYLQEFAFQMQLCDEADRTRMGVALEEAVLNTYLHGNLEVNSELRGSDDDAYRALVCERRSTAPYCDRKIHITASLSPERAEFVIRDEGPGFDPSSLHDPTDPDNLDRMSGRGILLMRTFMDEVDFNERGNEVKLVKRRPVANPSCEPLAG